MCAALVGGGCAAIPLTAVLGGAFSASAGAVVNAGREYAKSGAVYRTFAVSQDELRGAVGQALERMELAIVRDDIDEGDRVIEAHANEREIALRLEPVTRTVSRLRVVVEHGVFGKDLATATAIVERTEAAVQTRLAELERERALAATRSARGSDASSPVPAARPARSPRAAR